METLVTLEPRNDPNEILLNGLDQRQQLELRGTSGDSKQTLVLGRGPSTGIGDNSIGSSVLELSIDWFTGDEPTLRATLSRDAAKCRVHVNGQPLSPGQTSMLLVSGDMISLDGLRYEYRVHINKLSGSASAPGSDPLGGDLGIDLGIDSDDFWDANSHLASSPKSEEPEVTLSKTECSQLGDEVHCSVCLEIQVNSRSIHPCGHSVCSICITKLTECPQCRVKINSHIPNTQLDSLIDKLVSIQSLLDAEDIKSYHERKKSAKVFPAVDFTPMSGSKRRRPSSSTTHYRVPRQRDLHSARAIINVGGAQRTQRTPSGSMSFAFGDMDDEFYMPPHLGPEALAAATARAVSRSAAIANVNFDNITRHVPHRSRPVSRHHHGSAPSQVRQAHAAMQLRPPPPQAGSSLENAISID